MKEQVVTFPEPLQRAAARAEVAVKEKLAEQFAYDMKLKQADAVSHLKINEHTIMSLERVNKFDNPINIISS